MLFFFFNRLFFNVCLFISFASFFSKLIPLLLIHTLFPYTTLFRSEGIKKSRQLFIVIPAFVCVWSWFCEVTYSFLDRKSTRLNSSHVAISYAVFCLKKKNNFKSYEFTQIFSMDFHSAFIYSVQIKF